mgnify:CR=1 FL=1
MDKQAMQEQALSNARNNESMTNYPAIFQGFAEKGIAVEDIQPRVNVFTYNAWQALGRQVRAKEHGVKGCTWIPMTKKDAAGVEQDIGRKPKSVTFFHVSQTDPINGEHTKPETADSEQSKEWQARHYREASGQLVQRGVPTHKPKPDLTAEQQGFQVGGYYSTEFTPSA